MSSFSYGFKRTCGIDSYKSFASGVTYQYLTLRKTFLKVAELYENIESILDINLSSEQQETPESASAESQQIPTLRLWFVTLTKLIQSTGESIEIEREENSSQLQAAANRMQSLLANIHQRLSSLESHLHDFAKQFRNYELAFKKLNKAASEIFPLEASFPLNAYLNAEFAQNNDIGSSKCMSILSPSVSETLQLPGAEEDGLNPKLCLVHGEDERTYVETKTKLTPTQTPTSSREEFALLSSIEKVQILETFSTALLQRLDYFNGSIKNWSCVFTSRLRKRFGRRTQSYLELELLEMKKIVKTASGEWYPLQQTRCLHSIRKLQANLQSIKLLLPKLCSVLSKIMRGWTNSFMKDDFSLQSFQNAACKKLTKPLDSRDVIMNRSSGTWSFVLSPASYLRNYWCHNIVAPYQSHRSVPLMLQLLENDLTTVMDFESEFIFRLNRMSSSPHIFMDDIHICSSLLQRLHLCVTILIKQFQQMNAGLAKPFPSKFGYLSGSAAAAGNDRRQAKPVFSGTGNYNEELLLHWLFLFFTCLELVSVEESVESHEIHKNMIELCSRLYANMADAWKSLRRAVFRNYKTVNIIIQRFEELRLRSDQLPTLQDYKLRYYYSEPVETPEMNTFQESHNYGEEWTNNDLVVQLQENDAIFTSPLQRLQTQFTSLQKKAKVQILDEITRITDDLISSHMNAAYKHGSMTFQKEDTTNPTRILTELENILCHKYKWKDLEILIAIRSLRQLLNQILPMLNTLDRATSMHRRLQKCISRIHPKLSAKKMTKPRQMQLACGSTSLHIRNTVIAKILSPSLKNQSAAEEEDVATKFHSTIQVQNIQDLTEA